MYKLLANISQKNINYPIIINSIDLLELKEAILSEVENLNYIVIFSEKVYHLYSEILDFPDDKVYILKDGEKEKNFKNYISMMNFALSNHLKREDTIIAIGGGVVGDIAGFVASTYMRGINFIQVPTTLLAMTDSSVGGKVAINSKYGKNLIGAFYQPNKVFINTNFLKTLDNSQFKSGLGEVIKYAFIEKSCKVDCEYNLLNYLRENYEKILNKESYTIEKLIKFCVELKIAVVEADEKESGLRRILNYGHTYGHAIEKYTNYNKYTHGDCVISGILYALNVGYNFNFIDKEYFYLCRDIIQLYGYNQIKLRNYRQTVEIMLNDKKATNSYIRFIVPCGYAEVKEYNITQEDLIKIEAKYEI